MHGTTKLHNKTRNNKWQRHIKHGEIIVKAVANKLSYIFAQKLLYDHDYQGLNKPKITEKSPQKINKPTQNTYSSITTRIILAAQQLN